MNFWSDGDRGVGIEDRCTPDKSVHYGVYWKEGSASEGRQSRTVCM